MAKIEANLDDFRTAIQFACRPQNAARVIAGRQQVLGLPRDWVLARIEQVAVESLDLSGYWEYRRLLELAALVNARLVQQFVRLGLGSVDPDVQEAAQDFRA